MITVKESTGRELEIVVGSHVFLNDNEKGINEFLDWDNLPKKEQEKYIALHERYSLKEVF